MGISKVEEFTDKDNQVAKFCKALGHPARIAILRFLINQKSCFCGDIVNHLPLSQSTISQHLKELKTVGLIKGKIEGKSVCYCIDHHTWNVAQSCMNTLFDSNFPELNCC